MLTSKLIEKGRHWKATKTEDELAYRLNEAMTLLEYSGSFMIAKGCCTTLKACPWHARVKALKEGKTEQLAG
jgi:hypothetical protein